MASGRRDLIIACECGAGICRVGPLLFNPQCLFVCCPAGVANGGGCGFMQWRDTVDMNNITTWHSHHNFPPPPPLFTTTIPVTAAAAHTDTDTDTIAVAEAEEYTPPFNAADTPPPPPMTASQDVPPPPPPTTTMMCPCGAGPCSISTAKNGRNFYSCSVLPYFTLVTSKAFCFS
ncbi:hypothetical protein FCM35_KLT18806 [Carex littledalei]|uniref:Zinc finger GRF-type domain-containing protein n=1 Tax=Carex littledalei TaxID=544730 RepID=A0A833R0D2_9POAL|nr:hypothetical protein FCM35_KLT18806 [Carex littledalei]